jgi:type II secretory pathway pseudopilin PulG
VICKHVADLTRLHFVPSGFLRLQPTRAGKLAGLTLVEVLIAVSLLVMLMAVVFPQTVGHGALRLEAAADGMRRDMAALRLLAEKSGSRQRLETSAEQYRLGSSGEALTNAVDLPSGIALPPGLIIEFDSLGRPWRVVPGGAQMLAAAEYISVSSAEASVMVRVEPLTGLARVMR